MFYIQNWSVYFWKNVFHLFFQFKINKKYSNTLSWGTIGYNFHILVSAIPYLNNMGMYSFVEMAGRPLLYFVIVRSSF